MQRIAAAAFLVIGAVGTIGAECGEPLPPRPESRALSAEPGSCDGFFDYGDEFEITDLRNGAMRPVAFGVWEIDLYLEVHNRGDARFRALSVTPDFSDAPELGVVASPAPLAAEFGAIDPHGFGWSTAALRVQVPAANFGDLVTALRDGTVPLVAYGDEVNTLAPGVEIHPWSGVEDRMYYLASSPSGGFGGPINGDPGEGPFPPGQEFGVGFLEFSDDATSVFDDWDENELFYLIEEPGDFPFGHTNENIPDAFDRVRVVDAERIDDEDDNFTFWLVTLKRTDDESLPQIYSTGAFCTGASSHVDPPVQKSRLLYLDNHAVDPALGDMNSQGIRFNDLSFGNGAVKLSGQVQGHVLKPSVGLRIRNGRVTTHADFDTDIAFSAELRAEAQAGFAPEDVPLWTLCFPLPSLPAGPVSIPMNLQLAHTVGVEASLQAGAVVGFAKHFDSGFTLTCESGGGGGSGCTSEGHREESPIQITPPRLTDDTAAQARVETTLEGGLRVGSPYPVCDAGAGLFLATTAYGTLDVTPTQDPWWTTNYGVDVTAGIELNLLGLELARYDSELFPRSDPGLDSGIGGERTSGDDQRWAVAIDDVNVPNGVSAAKIASFPDGSSVAIASEAIGGRTPIVKLDRFGAMEWIHEFSLGEEPSRIRALPDGSIVVIGTTAWLARIDAGGNLLWSVEALVSRESFASARCSLYDVAPLETSPGHWDFVAVGVMGNTVVTNRDACALRVNEDGTLAWAKLYVGGDGGVQTFNGVTAMRDGNVMAVGSDRWYWVGVRSIPLFVKLDAATGDVIFWKGMPMTRGAELNAVVEASDGTLYAAGATSGIIYTTGTSLVARIAPDGSDAHHAELYQDEGWEAILDFETWIDQEGGDTPYDAWHDIAPSGDGFVIVGHTGLGTDTAARATKINRNLGIEWISTFDGVDTDWLTGVAPAADGIFVSGFSGSLPEADGGTELENQLWIMKLPFTGALDFLPGVEMTSRFVVPAVRDSTADPAVNPTDAATIDNPYGVEDAVVVSVGPKADLLVPASEYCVELLTATGHTTTTDTCPDP